MRRFLVALCVLPALALPLAAAEPKKEPAKAPFELLKSRHMAVSVKINGKGPFRLIFDTGAPTMLVNNRLAKEAGLIDKSTKRPPFALFGTMGQFTIKKLEIGELKVEDVNTIVMDHPTVEAISSVLGRIDGIVGFPFFARFRMTIDYQNKEMTFVPNDYKPGDIMEKMMTMLMSGSRDRSNVKILVPAGQWGISVDKDAKDEEPGVIVKVVFQGSAADKAGIKAGDRILTIDGRWTDSIAELFDAAGLARPGKPVPVKLLRDGQETKLLVTPSKGL